MNISQMKRIKLLILPVALIAAGIGWALPNFEDMTRSIGEMVFEGHDEPVIVIGGVNSARVGQQRHLVWGYDECPRNEGFLVRLFGNPPVSFNCIYLDKDEVRVAIDSRATILQVERSAKGISLKMLDGRPVVIETDFN